ncbi:hypothetical protein DERF_015894 [Dermatophagoides farinae]|uniref:Uncharacterized protein n=1 Tax=Dermatophagoides farinae TaxID=6954 RepID=A0A922HFJ7_DERFA|nr:hypothetical protein DERF_015894 [Dermatophagoides farinae]
MNDTSTTILYDEINAEKKLLKQRKLSLFSDKKKYPDQAINLSTTVGNKNIYFFHIAVYVNQQVTFVTFG